jgi:general secretion pathway protein J
VSPASRSRTEHKVRLGRGAASGFTLVEILVVMVIVTLISGILLFAFERVLDVRVRIAAFLDGSETPTLVASWFRDDIDGIIPDDKNGADVFQGAARKLSGLSVAPLNGMAGVPTSVTWEIDFDADAGRTYLRYHDSAAQTLTIASWPDDRGNFRYCGADFACYDTWPPPRGKYTQVPSLVLLNTVKGTEDWAILASPLAAHDPPPPPPRITGQ